MTPYETVIGLEVHLQLNTQTKIFCGCRNFFGENPNTQTCPVCLGLPGSLPVLNEEVLRDGIKVGLALNCSINPLVKFDRKNYYYPDLPKAFQISQYDHPLASNGHLTIKTGGQKKDIGIIRAHMEEDAGKLIHSPTDRCSLVDYNRAGTPLIEIVSAPDIRSPQEAYDYLTHLKLTLQYLDVSDCDMEKGSLRCDANVSVRLTGEKKLGTKAEIKNLNSFKAVKNALAFEVDRQIQVLESNGRIIQETRLWDEAKQMTLSMRSKEEAHDYRYFPEPDLVPFVTDSAEVEAVLRTLPELPLVKAERFIQQYALSAYDANVLVQDPPSSGASLSEFFEACAALYDKPKTICNWVAGPLAQELNTLADATQPRRVDLRVLTPKKFVELIQAVDGGELSQLRGKDVLRTMLTSGKTAGEIMRQEGLAQISDESTLSAIVESVLAENPSVVDQITQGKDSATGFLVGQAMKKTQGKANPKKIQELIKRRLSHG